MRLPLLPGPSDVRALVDLLVDAGPRVIRMVHTAEGLLDDVSALLGRIEQTRARADQLIARADETRVRTDHALTSFEPLSERAEAMLDDVAPLVARVDGLVDGAGRIVARVTPLLDQAEPLVGRATPLLDQVEPLVSALVRPMTELVPVLERLAETTDPAEVEALVALVNHLPELTGTLESDVLPMLATLSSVAPDLHDLLDVSRELNEILGKLPGLRGIKKRVEKEQEAEQDERSE